MKIFGGQFYACSNPELHAESAILNNYQRQNVRVAVVIVSTRSVYLGIREIF